MIRVLFLLVLAAPTVLADDAAKLAFFESKIRPLLTAHCAACHSAETKPAGGLRVDDRNGLLTGGNTGPAIVAGEPGKSLLLSRVKQEGKRRMPLDNPALSEAQIADLTTWIQDGAFWPKPKTPKNFGQVREDFEHLKKTHWALQPVRNAAIPKVSNDAWSRTAVDRFVFAKLDEKKLQPVGEADKLTLIRRVTFDLTGLPPTVSEIDAFVNDHSASAFDTVVDRLLASPAFGERWGRHWLDVARYGESTGPSRNIPYPHAWKYRDYVIDSVNRDVPYDRFIQEQVAGDLLDAKDDAERNRLLTATGYLALGVKDVNQRFKVRFIMDNVDEQIDAVTRGVLGLTVSCARCHDHKFDPVPMTDYYALAGIFTSTENGAGVRNKMGGGGLDYYDPANLVRLHGDGPAPDPAKVEALTRDVADAKAKWDAIRGTPEGLKKAADGRPTQRPFRVKYERLHADLLALSDPAQRGLAIHGVRDAKTVGDTEVRLRGEAEKLGPVVPRGYLSAVAVPGAKPINPAQSGRKELAAWLTDRNNPLTYRVIVNRVWGHVFGRGIVSTVDNFGLNGDTPSHPELLDYLAAEFAKDPSVKKLVRSLVLSRTYQLSSGSLNDGIDPANRWLWQHSPRRLDAEEIRDAMLAHAGVLDRQPLEGSPAKVLKMVEMRDNGPEAYVIREAADTSVKRSVYLPLLRGITPRALEAFDPVDQTLVSGQRETTTVPTQSLYMLNSAFVRQQAFHVAELLDRELADSEKVTVLYRRVLGRVPTAREADRAVEFVRAVESTYRGPFAKDAPKPVEAPKPKKEAEPTLDPDQVDQTGEAVVEKTVLPKDAKHAAWLSLAQSLFATAEYRYVR